MPWCPGGSAATDTTNASATRRQATPSNAERNATSESTWLARRAGMYQTPSGAERFSVGLARPSCYNKVHPHKQEE